MRNDQQPSAYLVNGQPNPEYAAWVEKVRSDTETDQWLAALEGIEANAERSKKFWDLVEDRNRILVELAEAQNDLALLRPELAHWQAECKRLEGEIVFVEVDRQIRRLKGKTP